MKYKENINILVRGILEAIEVPSDWGHAENGHDYECPQCREKNKILEATLKKRPITKRKKI